jgi:nitroalkane oxidase
VAIDFALSDSQQELQANAKAFAEGVLRPNVERIDRAADGWESFLAGREAYREMARAGFTKSFIPVDYGGAGFSMLDFAIAAEELSRIDVNVPTTLLGSGLGLQPVIQHGTPEQKERFLRPFADDSGGDLLASYAFTDVGGGANFDSPDPAGGMQTIARRDGGEWVITGEKHYTTNGTGWDKTGCQLYTVVCRTDHGAGADDALAVIAVPGDSAAITVVDVYDKVGHRGVVTPPPALRRSPRTRRQPDRRAGEAGQAHRCRRVQLDRGPHRRRVRGHDARGLRIRPGFARTEKKLGTTPIIEHQNVGFMLADIKMRIEACRCLTWKACHDFERTAGRAQELAIMTKVYSSEAAVTTIYDCMRVVGITSYTKDLAPLERIMSDAMVFPLYDGGNQGVRRRQLHEMLRQPGYDAMLAARGDIPPWEQ